MTYPTPSAAIANDACPLCLGDGITYKLLTDQLSACSACGGSGLLADTMARQCDDPHCVEHHPQS
jgi:DnaJ-class molecular chaperone